MNTSRKHSLDSILGGLLVAAGIAWSVLPVIDRSAPAPGEDQIVHLERVVVIGHRDAEIRLATQSHAPRVN